MDAVGKVIKFAWIPGLVALFGLSYVFMNTDSISKEDTVVDKNYEPAYSFVKPPFQPDPAGYGNFLVKEQRQVETINTGNSVGPVEKIDTGNIMGPVETIDTGNSIRPVETIETQRFDLSIAMETVNRKFDELLPLPVTTPVTAPSYQAMLAPPAAVDSSVYIATIEDLMPLAAPVDSPPPNPLFLFHNKLPKSGSTTMKWLLVELQARNNFKLDHQRYCIHKDGCFDEEADDGPNGERDLAEYMKEKLPKVAGEKYVLLKHHHWFNFTSYGLPQPTYINVARDPVTRFASRYYFQRYGWERNDSGSRTNFNGKKSDKQRSLDECVEMNLKECTDALQVMVKYFCGTTEICNKHSSKKGVDWDKVAKSTEMAKIHIARDFYVIGILEHFDAALRLFEKVLPDFFTGAYDVYNTPEVQEQRESSKSKHHAEFSNQTRQALETGLLRYEVDIYNLIKAMFFQKLQHFNIPISK